MGTTGLWLGAFLGTAAIFAGTATSASASYPQRSAAVSAFDSVQAATSVDPGWTGSVAGCSSGTESPASLTSTLQALNVIRGFAGVLPVTFDAAMDREALSAALMARAAGDISHTPDKSWPCYSKDGADTAAGSNLYLGLTGASAMLGYAEDPGISTLGHRRWLLDPGAMQFGSGSTDTTNALKVVGSYGNSSRLKAVAEDNVVAWPAPGWFPSPWVFKDWSASIGGRGRKADVSAARVTVTVDGSNAPVSGLSVLPDGSGTGATLSWQVGVPASASSGDHDFHVSITGVKVDKQARTFSYDVQAFDPAVQLDAPDAAPVVTTSGGTNSTNGATRVCAVSAKRLTKARKALSNARRQGRKARITAAMRNLKIQAKARARHCA